MQDSFRIVQNEDGSYTAEWDREDPEWKWLNALTSSQIEIIMKQAIQSYQEEYGDD